MSNQAPSSQTNTDTQSTLVKFRSTEACDKCGRELKTATFPVLGILKTFRCMCPCEVEEDKARKQAEEDKARKDKLERLFKQSRLGERFKNASFDKFIVSKETEKVFNDMMNYAENFKSSFQGTSVMIFSGCGTGKTMLTSSVVNHLVKNGISAILCVVPDLLLQIRSTFGDSTTSESQLLRGLADCQLLVMDDLGSEKHKGEEDWAAEKIYQIVNCRYNTNKATIFTTNCDFQELYSKLGKRTFSRIMEMCEGWRYDLNNVPDWRLKGIF